jgi:hypothetical protein
MDSVRNGVNRSLESAVAWLPHLLGALLILFIGAIVAKLLQKAMQGILSKADFDNRLHAGQGGNIIQRAVPSPARLLGSITYWLVFLGALSLAATALGSDALTDFIAAIYSFIPRLIVAILIFITGSAIAAGVATLVNNTMGDTPTGKLVESIAPVTVIGLTIFMILDQLGIAPVIVTITYAALLGSVALGSALAFGLGGRDVAARMLETTYTKGVANIGQAKADVSLGKERVKQKVDKVKAKARR